MKAIYINLDPYLAAFAAWVAGGKSGPEPSFQPLPLAVTIPLGQDVVLLVQGNSDDGEDTEVSVDGETVYLSNNADTSTDTYIGSRSLSAYSGFTYWTRPVSGDSVSISVDVWNDENQTDLTTIPFTVLVRREQASGPVDLVDFTPPASAIAAGTDLKGTKFDGNEIVADESTGALSAPAGD